MYPTIRVGSRPGELFMGVFDGNDAYVDGSALDRRSGEKGTPVPRILYGEPVDAPEPEAIYAGTLYFHFGHFLLESLARAWYAHRHPRAAVRLGRGVRLAGNGAGALAVGDPGRPRDHQPNSDPVRPESVRAPARAGHRLPLRRRVPSGACAVPRDATRARRRSRAGSCGCRGADRERRPRPERRRHRASARPGRLDHRPSGDVERPRALDHLSRAEARRGRGGLGVPHL